jgi:hypothetical protein
MRYAVLIGLLQFAQYAAAFVTPALLHEPASLKASSRMHMTAPGVQSTLLAVEVSSMHSTQFGSDQLIALGTTGIKEADQLGMYIICLLLLLYSTFAIDTVMKFAVDAAKVSTMYCSLAGFALGVCCTVALTPYMSIYLLLLVM